MLGPGDPKINQTQMLSLKCSESRRRGTDTSTEAGHCAVWVFSYAGTGQDLLTEIRRINRSLGEAEEAMPAKGKIQAWPSGAPRSRRHPKEKEKKKTIWSQNWAEQSNVGWEITELCTSLCLLIYHGSLLKTVLLGWSLLVGFIPLSPAPWTIYHGIL